jgi:hypothetical protein
MLEGGLLKKVRKTDKVNNTTIKKGGSQNVIGDKKTNL